MPIKVLPMQLANQIAAGEVVERPASIVKELLENSLDAGATSVDVTIENGGSKAIIVKDNGKGIVKDELALALSRHATSKISTLDDLEAIMSLGFRGEALASISSVARLSLKSKPETQEQGWQAQSEGREMAVDLAPVAHPQGTSVEVLDLFYNTPARRKFLRADRTEFQHIDELLKRVALARADVQFKLKHNGKIVRHLPRHNGKDGLLKRVQQLCGKAFVEQCVELKSEMSGYKLRGWVAGPGFFRAQNDLQFAYVNGRMMRDKLLNHAIREAFEGLIPVDSYPAYVLYFDCDPLQVDVNVHPAKHEVRFQQAREVHDFVYASVNEALQSSFTSGDENANNTVHQELNETSTHQYIKPLESAYGSAPGHDYVRGSVVDTTPISHGAHTGFSSSSADIEEASANYQSLLTRPANQYQVLELDETLLLVKQEKPLLVRREELLAYWLQSMFNEKVVSQPLLMPITIPLNDVLESATLEQLAKFGLMGRQFQSKLILSGVPARLRNANWIEVLNALVNELSCASITDVNIVATLCHVGRFEDIATTTLWHELTKKDEAETQKWLEKNAKALEPQQLRSLYWPSQ